MDDKTIPDDIPIGRIIGILSNMILRLMNKTFSNYPFNGAETGFISHIVIETRINPQKDIFQKDLEKEFNLRSPTATETIKKLEQKGFIIRKSLANDARKKKILPTDKAYEYFGKIENNLATVEEKITKNLTEEEKITWKEISKKIFLNLKEEELNV